MKTLGRAFRPHGLKGGAIFRVERDCPEEYVKEKLKPGAAVVLISLEKQGVGDSAVVERVIFSKKILLYFQEYSDRKAIERLLPFELRVESDQPELSDDLTGFTVCSQETGEEVGKVVSIGSNGVQDILEVRGKENFAIPRVPRFVGKIDKVGKKVFVWIPEYDEA